MCDKQSTPKTLLEAVRYFSDLDVCHAYMIRIRWPNGEIACPKCGSTRVGNIKSRRMLQCKEKGCRKQFSTKVGTIFEDSPLGLDKWFVAVWSITNAKNGISSHELSRALGVTQKSTWFMLHRIRLAMKAKSFAKITGTIESDETFVGGKAKNMHKHVRAERIQGRGTVGKAVVHGVLERAKDEDDISRVDVAVVQNQKRRTLAPRIRDLVEEGSRVCTDALKSYEGLEDKYIHQMVDHAKEYVREGDVHTNCMENFWALLKRSLSGTYVCASPKHLQAYCDEQVMRFNERDCTDAQRFEQTMSQVVGRRIQYKQLIAKTTEA